MRLLHQGAHGVLLGTYLAASVAGCAPVEETSIQEPVSEEFYELTGDYLGHDHTLRHFKEPYYSKLADKRTHSQWVERGATTMEERAAQQVEDILTSHKPDPLPADVQRDINNIVRREQSWIDSRG